MNLGEKLFNKATKVVADTTSTEVKEVTTFLEELASRGEFEGNYYGSLTQHTIQYLRSQGVNVEVIRGHQLDKQSYKISFRR